MYCTNCGRRNPEGANFCGTCGAPLRRGSVTEDTTIIFTVETEGEVEEDFAIPMDDLEEGKAILLVRRGPNAGTKFYCDKDVVSCGRNPDSDVFLDDVTVSRKHAEIRREDGTFRVVDVGSLNGTFVNRRRVENARLSNGDEIQIGKFKLVFFTGSSPSA